MECHINSTADTSLIPQKSDPLSRITLAVSTQWHVFPEKFDWLVEQGFALEYTPDPDNLAHLPEHLSPYLAADTQVRHHAYFPGYEIGEKDYERSERAIQLHFQAIDTLRGVGEQNVTVHVGLTTGIELDYDRVALNLGRLVDYSNSHGITLSLENLRFGPTSNPEIMLDWTRRSGARITMDIGHAVSCDRVVSKELTVPQLIDMFSHDLVEVHFYESETDRHHAPRDMSILGPVVDKLLETDCRWWTIELDSREEILHTRDLITNHLCAHHDALGA